jgi:hypothetical protein
MSGVRVSSAPFDRFVSPRSGRVADVAQMTTHERSVPCGGPWRLPFGRILAGCAAALLCSPCGVPGSAMNRAGGPDTAQVKPASGERILPRSWDEPFPYFQHDGPFTLAEVVAPLPYRSYECGAWHEVRPLEFGWARAYYDNEKWRGRTPIMVVCHGDLGEGNTVVRFFLKRPAGFEPALAFDFGWGGLSDPVQFAHGGDEFVLLRHNSGGSSSHWRLHVVWLGHDSVAEVPIDPPVHALAHLLTEGQHSCTSRTSIRHERAALRFSFAIWNPGENNNFPSGGWVEGTMRLERQDGVPARFVVDGWTFHEPERDS